MKIIEEKEKKIIILEENDNIEISTLYGNKKRYSIKCLNAILNIDDIPINEIEKISMEKKEIEKMQKYLEENK